MLRRCCFANAVSFCWTIRNRDMDSFSCTLILLTKVEVAGMIAVDRVYASSMFFAIQVMFKVARTSGSNAALLC